ncbi:MAG TPA: hypothetical protein VJQ52_04345 [Steroidobacteraceae bacterium]|nr:hypothetical protein [Steroidobacteraceae bacterium]
MAAGSPIKPLDCTGARIAVGDEVEIRSVASCTKELPEEDQARLFALLGQRRRVVRFDRFGFVWLCFSSAEQRADFCLFPAETKRV